MEERPKSVVLASALALLGAFLVLVVTVIGLDVGAEGLLTKMAFCLLTLALFLAVAGSLNVNGKWSWRFLIFAEALCAAVPIAAGVYGAIGFTECALFVLIASAMILLTAVAPARRWVEADRL